MDETASATCQPGCFWTASGPHSDEAAEQHNAETGHDVTAHGPLSKPGCIIGPDDDERHAQFGGCLDADDVAEERFKARDYEGWAGL